MPTTHTPQAEQQHVQAPEPAGQSTQGPKAEQQLEQAPEPAEQSTQGPQAEQQHVQAPEPAGQSTQGPKAEQQLGQAPEPAEQSTQGPKAEQQLGQAPEPAEQTTQGPKAEQQAEQAPQAAEQAKQLLGQVPTAQPIASLSDASSSTTKIGYHENQGRVWNGFHWSVGWVENLAATDTDAAMALWPDGTTMIIPEVLYGDIGKKLLFKAAEKAQPKKKGKQVVPAKWDDVHSTLGALRLVVKKDDKKRDFAALLAEGKQICQATLGQTNGDLDVAIDCLKAVGKALVEGTTPAIKSDIYQCRDEWLKGNITQDENTEVKGALKSKKALKDEDQDKDPEEQAEDKKTHKGAKAKKSKKRAKVKKSKKGAKDKKPEATQAKVKAKAKAKVQSKRTPPCSSEDEAMCSTHYIYI
jgi:hypothetical protein